MINWHIQLNTQIKIRRFFNPKYMRSLACHYFNLSLPIDSVGGLLNVFCEKHLIQSEVLFLRLNRQQK